MTVSVLMPAFRPTYLAQALASVLAQGFEDYELIISDDSGEAAVQSIVERFRDPRIRYLRTAGRTGGAANVAGLWREARHPLLKFVFDDDLLLPNGLADLVEQAQRRPEAGVVFGHRDVVDSAGRIRSEPRLITPGHVVALSERQVAEILLGRCNNRIGEPTNVLVNRAAGVGIEDMLGYRGFDLVMLADVALYLNASRKGPVVGVGRTVSHFRRHEAQNSSASFNPQYAKLVCEWELFVRGEFAAGALEPAAAASGAETLTRLYAQWVGRLPELARLEAGLPRLREQIAAGDRNVVDQDFRAAWAETSRLVEARLQTKAVSAPI